MVSIAQLQELFAYVAWANRKLFTALDALSAEDYKRDQKTSFGSIQGTVNHLVWADELWLRRWQMAPAPAVEQGRDLETLAAARERWERVEAERARFVAAVGEDHLGDVITVRASSGGEFRHHLRETLLHVVDHNTYHRGQVIAMLRQLGVKPPVTGLVTFYRERGKA
jgi:uncharacterized damage-inducible protein DinB